MTENIKNIPENTMEKENNFFFPKESSETKKSIDDAENKINKSVETFAKALDTISPGLTSELLDIFRLIKEDTTAFGGLSESDLWLHSLGLLYERNINKIPDKLESILNKMLALLTQYKSVKKRSKTLEDMLRACASINEVSHNEDYKFSELGITPSTFKPTTSNSRGRGSV